MKLRPLVKVYNVAKDPDRLAHYKRFRKTAMRPLWFIKKDGAQLRGMRGIGGTTMEGAVGISSSLTGVKDFKKCRS
jgi:hypothetical protein